MRSCRPYNKEHRGRSSFFFFDAAGHWVVQNGKSLSPITHFKTNLFKLFSFNPSAGQNFFGTRVNSVVSIPFKTGLMDDEFLPFLDHPVVGSKKLHHFTPCQMIYKNVNFLEHFFRTCNALNRTRLVLSWRASDLNTDTF